MYGYIPLLLITFGFYTQDFREIELKLLSTQDLDRSLYPTLEPKVLMERTADNSPYPTLESMALMRTTGEIVFVRHAEKEGDLLLRLYTQQGESLDQKNIKWPCDFGHRFELQFLFIQILWREYLVISCMYCKDIKLLDMETLEVTTAFSDAQLVGKLCKGWHKIYAKLLFGFVELDCSSAKLTKIRQIQPNEYTVAFTSTDYKCYVPPPHAMIIGVTRTEVIYMIHATSLGDPNQTGWGLSKEEVNGKEIKPDCVVYSSRHDALLAVDQENKTVWVLHPSTGKVLQEIELNIDVTKCDRLMNAFLRGSQLVIVSNSKIYNFSLA